MQNPLQEIQKYLMQNQQCVLQEVSINKTKNKWLKHIRFIPKQWYSEYFLVLKFKDSTKQTIQISPKEKERLNPLLATINMYINTKD